MLLERVNLHRLGRAATAAVVAGALWGCDDPNLFEPRTVAPPEIVGLSAPAEVRSGETLDVRVRAIGELRIDSISVKVRGAFNAEKALLVASSGLSDVVADASFEVPEVISDTLAVVSAVAVDAQGNASAVVTDTVRVVDTTPPSVSITLQQRTVGLGKDLRIQVQATDNVALAALGYRVWIPDGDTVAVELASVAGSRKDSTFVYRIPDDLPLGDVVVEGLAVDREGNLSAQRAASPLTVIFIDDQRPTVDLLEPRNGATQPAGDSVLVRVALKDNGGVDSVRFQGVAFRGNPDLGTDTIVARFISKVVVMPPAPKDTVVRRFLLATSDSTSETVAIIATAYDVQGNVSADTATLIVGGPKVEILNIEDGQEVLPGRTLSVRIRAADPQRLIQVQLEVDGAIADTVTRTFNPPVDTVTVDTVLVIPADAGGDITLVASARNALDVRGESAPITLRVLGAAAQDTIPPSLGLTATAPPRMELQDQVSLEVVGSDDNQGSGIVTAGFTVLAISPVRGDTLVQTQERTFDPPRTGNVSQGFGFKPFNVDSLALPDTLVYEITGYMIDDVGNCAATVSDSVASLGCRLLPTGEIVAVNNRGRRITRPVVAGRTVLLPQGGRVLDAVVDTVRRNLLLSNFDRDRVEVFRLPTESFNQPIPVGSEPWGMSLNRDGDTLLVANSGGTNVSNVWLGDIVGSGAIEDGGRRLLTPDVVLFDIERAVDESGLRRFTVSVIPDALPPGFSDRPQYVAVDSTGRILYSTKTTLLGDVGTIRKAFVPEGMTRTEVKLFLDYAELLDAPDFVAVANIDDIAVVLGPPDTLGFQEDQVVFFDHIPGDTTRITGGPETIENAFAEIVTAGSDMFAATGRWDVEALGFRDTTFVTASGDGGWVVFGEAARQPVGRVIMYDASNDAVSSVVQVTDILTNASEVVRGVGLNHDGTLGVARGFQAYFFSTDLRLQGVADLPAGGAGASMHPLHANYPSLQNRDGLYDPDTHLAFLGSGEGTIEIVDAFHFQLLGRIFIRDVVTGPLRAALPFPEDNAGFICATKPVFNGTGELIGEAVDIYADANGMTPHPSMGGPTEDRCIVLKLYGVTSAGGVVVVEVRKGDVVRNFRQQNGG